MKYSRPFVACLVLLLTALPYSAWASPPVLTPLQSVPFPTEGQPGQPYTFHLLYQQKEGDAPTALEMVIDGPSGHITAAPSSIEGNDPAKGITATWTFTPQNTGTYRFHFQAVSSTKETGRYPEASTEELEFASSSLAVKYIIFVVGLLIALAFLPFIVYVASRTANKRGDPAAAARIGLFIGVLASYALFWFLFAGIYHAMGLTIAAVAAVAILIALFTRR